MTNPIKITRRRFLKWTGGLVGAGVLTCSGLGVWIIQQPAIEYSESSCRGEPTMKNRILVTYASRAGSTGTVAEAIGQTLCGTGAIVDVRPIKNVTDLTGYDAVVVGSAIRMGQWLPEAVQFVKTHQAVLQQISTAYFTVCLTLKDDTEENRRVVAAYTDPVRAIHQPDQEAFFAGQMDYSRLSLLDSWMARWVKAPEGDWRNWEAIRGWAKNLSPVLLPA